MIDTASRIFASREEAGRLLANQLLAYRDDPKALILALPPGGVPVGVAISQYLHLPLDVFITRKVGVPGNQEFALGAVAETGFVYVNEEALRHVATFGEFLNSYLDREMEVQKEEIALRQKLYRDGNSLPPLSDRTVLLVDDGVATGSTYLASLHALRDIQVSKIVAAIPVGPAETLERIAPLVDELVVLHQPSPFLAVGMHYQDFAQVEDDQVCQYLKEAKITLRCPEEQPS